MSTSATPQIPPTVTSKADVDTLALRASPRPVTRLNRRMLAVLAGMLGALILPDTSSISLDRLPGIDPAGYVGLEDGVDWHWDRILAGAALSTPLGVRLIAAAAMARSLSPRARARRTQ